MKTVLALALPLLALALAAPAAAAPDTAPQPAPDLALFEKSEPVETAGSCPYGEEIVHIWDWYAQGDAACKQDCQQYCASQRAVYSSHFFSARGAWCRCTCCQY